VSPNAFISHERKQVVIQFLKEPVCLPLKLHWEIMNRRLQFWNNRNKVHGCTLTRLHVDRI